MKQLKNFQYKKEIASQLLETFEEYFNWDKGYYLAQFIDVNVSFRLHCYFVQFGLDFKKIAIFLEDLAFSGTFSNNFTFLNSMFQNFRNFQMSFKYK